MCIFCSTDENLDILDRTAMNDPVNLGFAGELTIMNRIEPVNSVLEMTILNDNGDAQAYKKDIVYCPFCGRKLLQA